MLCHNNQYLLTPQDVGLGWGAARQSVLAGLRAAFSPRVTEEFIARVEGRMVV